MDHIVKTFPGVVALDDVNLVVHRQEIHAICGENGAGKSTLMKVLSGVHPAGTYKGTIEFDGKPVSFANLRQSEEAGIAIIHQELALIPELSIAENMFIGNEKASGGVINWNETRAATKKYLALVGLKEDPDTKIKDLGVGKQQLIGSGQAEFSQAATQGWDPKNAQTRMDSLLASTYPGTEAPASVLSPNDTLARAVLTSIG